MKISFIITGSLFVVASQVNAATSFIDAANAVDKVFWETWTSGPTSPGTTASGTVFNQGAGIGSANVTTSFADTTITDDFSNPPGGLLSAGDRFYIHNGAFSWNSSITTTTNFTHARVTYKLLNFGLASPSDFNSTASILGATEIDNNTYTDADGTYFYRDFELSSATNTITATFGDNAPFFPGFPGTFKSIDGIQIETFNDTPSVVPEPSSLALLALGSISFLMRRKRS